LIHLNRFSGEIPIVTSQKDISILAEAI